MNNYKVSILIPCFNGEKFLNKCLDSCINQTYKDIEIIIVNDGSNDLSESIINDFIKKDQRIKLINQKNKGLAYTRNVLLKNAKTKYGFFLDVDDWIEKDCIEEYLININNNHLVINSSFIDKGNKSKIFYITKKINKKTNNYSFLINNTLFAWGVLFDVDYLKKINFNFYDKVPFFEDAGVMSYLVFITKKISFINKPKYHYCIYKNSLSHSNKFSYEKICYAIEQLKNFYNLINSEKFIKNIPKAINDQLCLYHCIIFTYIQFCSNISRLQKKELKCNLKKLESKNFKLHFPKRYWKFFYFLLYRFFGY